MVDAVERLLAQRVPVPAIAARVGVTPYVVGVIREDRRRNPVDRQRVGPRARRTGRRVPNRQSSIDAATIRLIARMLAPGHLSHAEIAREVGVSTSTVDAVATGRRQAITLRRPVLDEGETFLPRPIRCSVCRALISVIPCRACRAERERQLRLERATPSSPAAAGARREFDFNLGRFPASLNEPCGSTVKEKP